MLADVTNDRRVELISLCAGEGAVRLFRNESTGTAVRGLTARVQEESIHLRWSIVAGREEDVTIRVLRRDHGGAWMTLGSPRSLGSLEYELVDPWPSVDDPQYRLDEYESGQLVRSIGPIRVAAPFGSLPDVQVSGANPLQESVEFRISIVSPGEVTIRLFDIQGRHVLTLMDDPVPAGRYRRQWDGQGEGGARLASGIYLARIEAPGLVRTVRMVIRR
ncbi:MAG: hypothetical protein FD129_1438 [bacterium]|nr:MAG: hypothetical protein FD129_1438 [bacterium]